MLKAEKATLLAELQRQRELQSQQQQVRCHHFYPGCSWHRLRVMVTPKGTA